MLPYLVTAVMIFGSVMADIKPSVDQLIEKETQVKSMDFDTAMDHYKKGDAVFLDIRSPAEWIDLGVIPNSVLADGNHLPLFATADSKNKYLHKTLSDPNKLFIVYCKGYYRGFMFAKMMHAMGYPNVAFLAKGIGGWRKSGGPMVMPNSFNPVIKNAALRGHEEAIRLTDFGREIRK